MAEHVFVGIDTSNYTTSAAVVLEDGGVLVNIKKLLPVADGARGLRQSDAVFAHIKQLPSVLAGMNCAINERGAKVAAVGYSYAPRDAEGSYMPCFLVGEAIANAIAGDRLLPLFRFSHQAGHIMAAVHSSSAYDLIGRSFAAFHVSGGTTELTLVTPDAKKVFRIEKIGGTRDLHAGQLIDRIGVMMGLPFPAGKELDRLSLQYNGKIPNIKTSVDGLYFNLSGAENMASDLFKSSGNRTETAVFVLEFIACSLLCLTENLRILYPEIPIVYSGGVMSSEYIKKRLGFIHDSYFAAPEFSSDNAAGCALLCLEKWRRSPERGASV